MRIFPSKFDFIVFKTGYTSRLFDKDLSKLDDDNFDFFGNVLDNLWREEGQSNYVSQNEKELEIMDKNLNLSEGSLVFSVKNEITPLDINSLINEINCLFDYCNGFEWNTVYEMDKITLDNQTFLVLTFDTESG